MRNPKYPSSITKFLIKPDSIIIDSDMFYKLDRDLMLNGRFVLDSFTLENCYNSIAKPDSIYRVGTTFKKGFKVDNYDLYFGKSLIKTAQNKIFMIKIRDRNLKLFTIGVGSNRINLEKILKLDFPSKDTLKCLGIEGGHYRFIFDNNENITEIEYYSRKK